ncbi:uncharacterized protein LOC103702166 isoform X2 [Phoenix dactylifera]|uniref:Uncharacterized protein LOC103702166 isoform X2 n=1 Tax=Phoenix dactylifera TaxID=42345 RepID=A0A8B7BPN6_PHODC|nr:uncharacterized protein LOC103702166 isoform X2 [Phoenix dactylifera]
MAYRRKQGVSYQTSSSFEDYRSAATEPPSLAAQAIRASAAHRDSSLFSAYGESSAASSAAHPFANRERSSPSPRDSAAYEYTSMKNLNESKYGFWGVLARKAKAVLEDDNTTKQFETPGRNQPQAANTSAGSQFYHSNWSPHGYQKTETPPFQKSSDTIASSLNYIGDTIKNALEEGRTVVENKTADIIHETRKLHIRRKGSGHNAHSQAAEKLAQHIFPQIQTDYETQLKASRDVANAMAAKAKLLLRELKTVKADLAFAKERCSQLEEENKMLRESHEKGSNPEDDDLIRLQLETLLAEKARLAHENSTYARENRFLREIVEYHQLNMQDVVYVDEGIEEVTEVYSIQIPPASPAPAVSESSSPLSPTTPTPSRITRSTATTQPPPAASPSILVPESCPIIPTPPTRPSQAVPPNTRASPPPV